MTVNPTKRFSDRVTYYIQSRPHYPAAMLEFMKSRMGLITDHVIADVGSGTGILTELFLQNGTLVYAIEPNEPMRTAAEELLARYPNFRSINGTAEATALDDRSVDFVVAGQAFHWFDLPRARREFARILRGCGWIVLVWNDRRLDRPTFAVEYERIIRTYNTDFDKINHRKVSDDQSDSLNQFFGGQDQYEKVVFDNPQTHDWSGVRSRLLSSSYMPLADDPRYAAMMDELKSAFEAHQQDGVVRLEYDTRVYYGRLD